MRPATAVIPFLLLYGCATYGGDTTPELSIYDVGPLYAEVVSAIRDHAYQKLNEEKLAALEICLNGYARHRIGAIDAMSMAITADIHRCFRQDPYAFYYTAGEFKTSIAEEEERHAGIEGKMLRESVAYIKITSFMASDLNEKGLESTLPALITKKTRIVILDLRYNRGGHMPVAEAFLGYFALKPHAFLFQMRGRKRMLIPSEAPSRGPFADRTLVVLVNRYTASAAELVTGVLQRWGATVIGPSRTHGKGTIQHPVRLQKGVLYLTKYHYHFEDGYDLDNAGIMPDILVTKDITPEDALQLIEAKRKNQ